MKEVRRQIFLLLSLCLAMIVPSSFAQSKPNAQTELQSIVNKLSAAKSLTAKFSCSSSDGSKSSGSIKIKDKKFAVSIANSVTIYDGKDVWQANEFSKEINIFEPDDEMLAEINPLILIKQGQNAFKASRLTAPDNQIKLSLTPKAGSGQDNVKRIVLTANRSTNLPAKAEVELKSGEKLTFNFSDISLNASVNDSSFKLDKSKYPGYQIVDLRD